MYQDYVSGTKNVNFSLDYLFARMLNQHNQVFGSINGLGWGRTNSPLLAYETMHVFYFLTKYILTISIKGLMLSDLEAINRNNLNLIPEMPGVINFQKRRLFAKVIQHLQKYQGIQYSLHPIEVSKPAS